MTDKICLAPWTHLHTWPNNSVYPCCLAPMENPVGNLKNQTLEEVWNSQELKDMRLSMLKGKLPYKTWHLIKSVSFQIKNLRREPGDWTK